MKRVTRTLETTIATNPNGEKEFFMGVTPEIVAKLRPDYKDPHTESVTYAMNIKDFVKNAEII